MAIIKERAVRDIDNIKSLIEYIQKNIKKGYEIEELKWALINQGNSRTAVEKAIKYVQELEESKKPKRQEAREEIKPIETLVEKIEEKSLWQKIKSWFS